MSIHQEATNHNSNGCHTINSQLDKLRAQWAQPRDAKRHKNNDSSYRNGSQKRSNNGDLHALLHDFNKVKASLKKAMKQRNSASGKRKERYDEQEEEGEIAGNFHTELEQLSLSDIDSDDVGSIDE